MKVKKWVRNTAIILFAIALFIITGIADNSNINSVSTVLIYGVSSILLSIPYFLIFIHDIKNNQSNGGINI